MPNPPLDPYGRSIPSTPGATMIVDSAGQRYPLRSTLKTTLTVTDSPDTGETILAVPGTAGNAAALAFLAAPTSSAESVLLDAAIRSNIMTRAQGMITETFSRTASVLLGTVLIGGTVYFIPVPLLIGDIVTNISIVVTSAGTAMTLSKVGLYTKAGVRVATSADQAAAWATTGLYTIPMAAPYTAPASDQYFVAIVAAATLLPQVARSVSVGASGAFIGLAVGAGALPYGTQTGQSDLPANATIAAGSASIMYWGGIS